MQNAGRLIPGHWKSRILAQTAFFFLVAASRADITLSTQAVPQADAQSVRVLRGKQTTILLRGHQGGGGSLTFRVVQRPEHGELSQLHVIGDNRASVAYENDGAESVNSDRFRYVVKTNDGRISSPAEVRIVVENVPAKMVVPARVEFGEVQAGESVSRSFAITNEGGGILEGRLSASSPWQLSSADYRVKAGRTESITIRFAPDEGRQFIGQITLTGADGNQTTVQLAGAAISPIRAEPDHLEIAASTEENSPRVGSVVVTNQTERILPLKLDAGPKIESIPDFTLAPHEKKTVSIGVRRECSAGLDEDIVFAGVGFKLRLHVNATAPANSLASNENTGSRKLSSTVLPSVKPIAATKKNTTQSIPIATPSGSVGQSATAQTLTAPTVALKAKRLDDSHWELRWPQPKAPVTRYRIEERLVSLDRAGNLQTSWREIAAVETTAFGKEVIAHIKGLEPTQRHMVRVTAIGGSGKTLWESPVAALTPSVGSPRIQIPRLVLLGIALAVFLALRRRSNRAVS